MGVDFFSLSCELQSEDADSEKNEYHGYRMMRAWMFKEGTTERNDKNHRNTYKRVEKLEKDNKKRRKKNNLKIRKEK